MINPSDTILDGDAKYIITDNQDNTKNITLANTIITLGTPLTKKTLNDIIGMGNKTTTFNSDGSITETDGTVTKTTTFNEDGSITETVSGGDGLPISKETIFNDDGSISETLINNEEAE